MLLNVRLLKDDFDISGDKKVGFLGRFSKLRFPVDSSNKDGTWIVSRIESASSPVLSVLSLFI